MSKASIKPSRRSVLTAGAGLTFSFALGRSVSSEAQQLKAAGTTPDQQSILNAYVKIAPNGTITILAPAAEMGQGIKTAIPLVIAEELDADWSKVVVENAPIAPVYAHPVLRSQQVVGSLSLRGYWQPARTAGAQARRVLMEAAAKTWNVPISELTTEPGFVVHAGSKRRLAYGDIAKTAQVPSTLPEIKPEDLKPASQFRLLGKDVLRRDVIAKSTGRETYSIDASVPGMVYATVAYSPARGISPASVNTADLKAIKGIQDVINLAEGVGIVGTSSAAVFAARKALKVTWSDGPALKTDSEKNRAAYLSDVANAGKKGVVGRTTGDATAAFAAAAKTVAVEVTTDYVYHAQMEPVGALASVTADSCEVWCGSQWASNAVELAAKTAGLPPEKVKFNLLSIGGGFGRRIFNDYVVDAVALSKAVNKPVKVLLSREDDFANARMRPMTAHRIEAALDATGKATAVRHRIAADTVVPYIYSQQRMEAQKGVDHVVFAGADVPYYDIANHTAEHIYQEHGVRVGAWRGIGAGANAFAIEAMIDELSVAAGKDPYEFRMALLKNERAKKVVEAVAKLADWPRKRAAGTGLGIAFARLGLPIPPVGESMSATVAEVSVNRETGKIQVSNLWCAVDVGLPVQPKNIEAQVSGSLIWGLSAALRERITIKDGRVEQQNYPDYDVMRMSDIPAIKVEIIRSGDVPLPVGELGLATVNPAIAGAFHAATGKRIRNAPFIGSRVREVLKA